MIQVNEYFNGNVKSLGLESAEGKATVGVIAAGEYEFGTSTLEVMTIISGKLLVKQQGETDWKAYKKFESFVVPKDSKFKVKAEEAVPYFCLYK